MNNYAVIENNAVVNTVVWDGETPIEIGELVEIPEGVAASIGWSYVDGQFIEPVQPEPESTQE